LHLKLAHFRSIPVIYLFTALAAFPGYIIENEDKRKTFQIFLCKTPQML